MMRRLLEPSDATKHKKSWHETKRRSHLHEHDCPRTHLGAQSAAEKTAGSIRGYRWMHFNAPDGGHARAALLEELDVENVEAGVLGVLAPGLET